MSNSRTELLKQAKDILSILDNAKIVKGRENLQSAPARLDVVRQMMHSTVRRTGKFDSSGLLITTATTFFRIGLCQELTNRFLLEYCLKYKKNDVTVIILGNPTLGHRPVDHMLVVLGPIKAPSSLVMGLDPIGACILNSNKANQSLIDFFKNNNNSVFVDPLLDCFGNSKEELYPLMQYCDKHDLTHVIGIFPYHLNNIAEKAELIKSNAYELATSIAKILGIKLDPMTPSTSPSPYQTSIPLFDNSKITSLLKKYNLQNDSQASLEKALRIAANNNQVDDLKILIKVIKNIDAADNQKTKRTAAHWAAFNNHQECYQLLVKAGASVTIEDADGKNALQYMSVHLACELD